MSNADLFALGFEVDTAALAQGKAAADQMARALLEVAKAMQAEEAAAKRAGEEERKKAEETRRATEAERRKAEETRRAAEEARRAADPHVRLADALGRIGQQAQGTAGGLGVLGESFNTLGASLSSPAGLNVGLNAASGALASIAPRLGPVGAGVAIVTAGFLAAAAAAAAVAVGIARQQEAFMLLEARLKNVYENGTVAKQVFADLSDLANKNGVALDVVADGYLRLARTNESIGLTRKQMLELTDAVQMLGRVSNASQGELQGGLMQFSQALAAGRLNGDELRSIMENLPSLAEAIADGLGVSVGQLRAMGAEGTLTSDKITQALLGQLPKIRAEFEGLPQTSEQAFTRVGNAWDALVARMGEVLNLSGIVTGFGNALATVLEAGNDAITPETDAERLTRLRAERQVVFDSMNAPSKNSLLSGIVGSIDQTQLDELNAQIAPLEYAEALLAKQSALEGMIKSDQAAISRAITVGTDVEKLLKQRKELETQIQTVKAGIEAAQRTPPGPEQREGVARLTAQLTALERQLASVKAPLADYISTTERMRANAARYGVGGAASIADEAKALFDAGNKAGAEGVITMQEAIAAVMDRRVVATENATKAMDAEIAAQERQIDAIGKGTQAQIDAEVATKALAYQMATFGETVDGPAKAAVDRYAEKLRELLEIQKELTDSQRLHTAQMKLAIEAQITAAIRAGATAGEIARLRRELETGVAMGAEGGNFPASLLTTESGGNLGAYNDEVGHGGVRGHGGRLQFGQARLDEAARAGIIQPMTPMEFSRQPLGVQMAVENWHFSDIDQQTIDRGLMKYIGQEIGGVTITQNGIRAMAHLGGMGGAEAFLNSGGAVNPEDVNGTSLLDYARIHGSSPTLGQQAVSTEAAVAAEQAAQASAQRVASLNKEAEAVARVSAADTEYAKAQARREEEIRKATESAQTPEDRAAIEAAMRAKYAAEDDAALADRLRAMEEANKLAAEQAKLATLPKREMLIETQLLEEINRLKAQGIALTEDEIKLLRQKITEGVDIDLGQQNKTQREKFQDVWMETAEAIGGALESAINQAVMTGKVDAESILKGLIADITSALTRAFIVQPLVSGLQSMFAAHGAVMQEGYSVQYAHGGIAGQFAAGGVVASPTLFPMARGAGLMGEAGPEAILPLSRGADGKLGVAQQGGGGTSIVINDMRTSAGAEPVEAQETTGPDGRRMISILVRDEVRRQVRNGELDKEMRTSFGVARQLTKR